MRRNATTFPFAFSYSPPRNGGQAESRNNDPGKRGAAGRAAMAIAPTGAELVADSHRASAAAKDMPWPSERAGFYALFCIIFATALNFFDLAIFGMLAERMKKSFEISDTML